MYIILLSKKSEEKIKLVMIDIFNKLANVVPIKARNNVNALLALKENFEKMGSPMLLCSENDGVFMFIIKEFLDCKGI